AYDDADAPAPEPQPAPPAHREANACDAQPTPADRTICSEPQLRELQRQLRQAYNEALEAHEDRALLRQRQLAWASARDAVADPDRLTHLYEERIRKLNAATAAARQAR
ncbi:MAG: lysozyme inhibitor LprI family protein, partial [Phenylobacterium sp.]